MTKIGGFHKIIASSKWTKFDGHVGSFSELHKDFCRITRKSTAA